MLSMTGYGKASRENKEYSLKIEVKSLNSKFSDVFCRLPKSLSFKEIELRNILSQQLERGKIELQIQVQKKAQALQLEGELFQTELIQSYYKFLTKLGKDLGIHELNPTEVLKQALALPNALQSDHTHETDEQIQAMYALVLDGLQEALKECYDFRAREGAVVQAKFEEYLAQISQSLEQIEALDQQRNANVRERLLKAFVEFPFKEEFDSNRFEQELIFYMEKMDISEEKVRLREHLDYFGDLMRGEGSGKKLSFMAQEIGREINTIGSKANDAGIQRLVVAMKDELEKIKEQTANIV